MLEGSNTNESRLGDLQNRHQHGHDVFPWAAFNECVSTVDSPLTTVGMAPILNDNMDEYGPPQQS